MTKEHCHSKQTKWRPRRFVYHEISLSLSTKHQPGQVFPMAKKKCWRSLHGYLSTACLGYVKEKSFMIWKGASEGLIWLSLALEKSVNQQISHHPSDAYILSPAWKAEEIRYPSPMKIQAPNEHTDKIFLLELPLLFKEGEVGTLGKGAVNDASSPWFPLLIYFMLH